MQTRRTIALLCSIAVTTLADSGNDRTLSGVQVVDEAGHALSITPESAWTDLLQSCQGRPVDDAMRTRIADGLLAWFARHDQPMMSIEELDSTAGVLNFRVIAGRIHHVFIKGGPASQQRIAASRWSVLEGQPLRVSALEEELDWFHRNPLHIAMLNIAEASSSDGAPLADVIVNLEQTHALRASLGYRNDGIAPLSEHRFTGSLEAADLFGLPSWWNAQSTVADDPSSYQQYRVGARYFLPWQHELALSGGLVRVSAPTDEFAGLINAIDAQSWTGSARYVVPFKLPSAWTLDVGIGADFRRTNNTLELGSLTLAGDADSTGFATDFTLRKQTLLRDTGLSLSLNYSPGGITSNDDDVHHSALRAGAEAQHFITRATVWHRRESPSGWTLVGQASGQWSDVPVLPQDQLMLATSSSVRGYDEASVLADRGLWGSIEVRTPALNLKQRAMQVQPLTFIDGGIGWDQARDEQRSIASVGFGVRMNLWKHLSASCAYAWRLTEPGGRLHLAVSATF